MYILEQIDQARRQLAGCKDSERAEYIAMIEYLQGEQMRQDIDEFYSNGEQ